MMNALRIEQQVLREHFQQLALDPPEPLIERILSATRPAPSRWVWPAAAAAALLICVGGFWFWRAPSPQAPQVARGEKEQPKKAPAGKEPKAKQPGPKRAAEGVQLATLKIPVPRGASKPLPPFSFERAASAIFVGQVGGPMRSPDGQQLIRLDVQRVLLGKLTDRSVETGDKMPFFGCIAPRHPQAPSARFERGARVLVYLTGSAAKGWSLHHMQTLHKASEKQILRDVSRYLAVMTAGRGKPTAATYRKLLGQRLDFPTAQALNWHAHPAAFVPLQEMLARLLPKVPVGKRLGRDAQYQLEALVQSLARARGKSRRTLDGKLRTQLEKVARAYPERWTRETLEAYLEKLK